MENGGLVIRPINPIPAAGNGTPQCPYEVSDVTLAELTLTFEGATGMTANNLPLGGIAPVTPLDGSEIDISFTSGIMTSIVYAAHNTNGIIGDPPTGSGTPTSLSFPMDFMSLTWYGTSIVDIVPSGDWGITSALVNLKGHHYYRGLPVPSTPMLFVLGLLVMAGFRSRHVSRPGLKTALLQKIALARVNL